MHKNTCLDLIRIFAALMVLSVHVGLSVGFDFAVGATAVKLFFIMSGYLSFVSLSRDGNPISYYKKRIIRIIPLYYFTLVLLLLENIVFAAYYGKWIDAFKGAAGPKFIRYFLFLQCIVPSDNWNLWNNQIGLWTMSAFFCFYLTAPWIFKIIRNLKSSILALVIALAVRKAFDIYIPRFLTGYPAEAGTEYYVMSNPIAVSHCFLLGVLVFYIVKEKKTGFYLGLFSMILVVTSFRHFEYELVYAIMLLIAVYFNNTSIILEKYNRCINWLANGTFALYLIHLLVIRAAQMIWYKIGVESVLAHAFFLYASCIVVSYVIYYGLIIKFERVIKNGWNKKKTIENPSL